MKEESDKNIAVPSEIQNPVVCPCNHKNWNNGKKHRGCTKYITVPDDYRLSIDRDCISFKKIYSLRTEAERYNARFKQTDQERLWVHSENAAKISIPLLILLCLPLLMLLLSLNRIILFVA